MCAHVRVRFDTPAARSEEYYIASAVFRDTIPAKKTSGTKSTWMRLTTFNPPTKCAVGFQF